MVCIAKFHMITSDHTKVDTDTYQKGAAEVPVTNFIIQCYSSHYLALNNRQHKGGDTYQNGDEDKGDVDANHCIVGGRCVLVPHSTLWYTQTRTVIQVEIIGTFSVNISGDCKCINVKSSLQQKT